MTNKSEVQVILKGLEVLTTLNQKNGLTVAELSKVLRLPRSTVFRLLKTLISEGYIQLDAGRRYRLTKKVRKLCSNIKPEPWVNEALEQVAQSLHEKFRWPVSVCSLRGDRILIDYVTDRQCPQLITRRMVGYQMTFLDMASSRVILAELSPGEFESIIAKVVQIERAYFVEHYSSLIALKRSIRQIKRRGYDENLSRGFRVLAVPLRIPGAHAAISIRMPHLESNAEVGDQDVVSALHAAAKELTISKNRRFLEP